jgi:hypothetical protein
VALLALLALLLCERFAGLRGSSLLLRALDNLNLATPFRLAWARLACSNRSGKMFLELDGILRGGNGSVCNTEGDAAA